MTVNYITISWKQILLGCLLCFTPLSIISLKAQDFYDINKIQEIKLYFEQSNWSNLLIAAAQSTDEPYIFCKKVVINGVAFDSVGAKYKGNSTFNATRNKNPWHIELDHYKEQDYQGYKDIKLANIFQDPSCVREALSYGLMQSYTDLPRANYAKVWVNDVLIGLYTNTEAVTKSFCKRKFPSSGNNVFVKCTPPSLMGGTGGASSLAYLGADSSFYRSSYEIYSDWGWQDLINLCDTLNNKTTEIEKILDVDRALWMLSFNIAFVNLDSYTGGFTQNYYLWRDDTKRFNPIIWDLNMSFGSFTNVGTSGTRPGSGGADSLALAKLSPFTHEANTSKPLISKLLANSRYRKMYIAHLKTMYNETFKSGLYKTRGEAIRKIIDDAVKNDPNNLSTYDLFKTNFYYGGASTGGIGFPPQSGSSSVTGIVSLVENKIKYFDTLTIMQAVAPVINNVSSTAVKINETSYITAKITGSTANGVVLSYRTSATAAFTKVDMYDDGLHKDGAAGDGVYGIGIKMSSPIVQYYIWAENNEAGIFSPERAEHEFYNASVTTAASDVVINELVASNTKTVQDPKGQYDDWIELYNKSTSAVDLSGWYISDNPDKRAKWQIPTGTTIPANGYLIIWADEDSSQNTATSLHCNFKLSASGESVFLTQKDTTIIADQVTFGTQKSDITWGRRPNGTGNFLALTPTFNANNDAATTSTEDLISEKSVLIFPNPVHTEGVTVKVDSDSELSLNIYNALGQVMYQSAIFKEITIETSNWQKGIYIVKVGNVSKKLVVN